MKRTGHVYRKGNSPNWYVRYRATVIENGAAVRKQIQEVLCPVDPEDRRLKRPPASVLKIAEEYLTPRQKANPHSTQKLADFVRETYFFRCELEQHASTRRKDRNRWDHHLFARVGHVRLRDFKTSMGQELLDGLARQRDEQGEPRFSRETLKRLKTLLSGIFSTAKRMDLVEANPMQGVAVPKNGVRPKKDMHAYSNTEIKTMRSVLPEPSRTIIAMMGYAGLIVSEVQGLEWLDYVSTKDGKSINVRRSIWEGVKGAPKTGARQTAVPVIDFLATALDQLRISQGNPGDDKPMFPASNGRPLRLNNLLDQQILPVLNRCAVCKKPPRDHKEEHGYRRDESLPAWHGWQALRRGIATNLSGLGISPLMIAAVLRNDPETSLRHYIKQRQKQARQAMNQFNDAIAAEEKLVQ